METNTQTSASLSIKVGYLKKGQSCTINGKMHLVTGVIGNFIQLTSTQGNETLEANTVVIDPVLAGGELMSAKDIANQEKKNANKVTITEETNTQQINTTSNNQTVTNMTYTNAAAIIDTTSFENVDQYVAAVQAKAPELDFSKATGKNWVGLCQVLGINHHAVAKGKARPAIDKVARTLNAPAAPVAKKADAVTVDAPKKAKSVAVKVQKDKAPVVVSADVTKTSSVSVAVEPTVTPTVSTFTEKAPKRIDFAKGEDGEDEFDAEMTAWILRKKAFIENNTTTQTVPVAEVTVTVTEPVAEVVETVAAEVVAEPVVEPKKTKKASAPVQAAEVQAPQATSDEADNVDETARQLADLLRKMNGGKKAEIDPAKVLEIVAQKLADFESQVEQKYLQHVETGFQNLTQATSKLIADEVAKAKQELAQVAAGNATTIQVQVNDQQVQKIDGLVHEQFENILRHVSVRDHVMLVGPAGSGKTTVCENVAQALGLDFYCKSVCAQTSKAELLGYMDANGNFVSTEFRVAYQNGGVFVLDEIDAGNPNVIAVLNSALANNYCAFADGMIRKHEDFVLIACANTFGTGASREYVGRNQLDSATLDRFSVLEFGYDLKLETALAPDKTFCKFVQAVRKDLAAERVVISPRASIQGGKLLAAGHSPAYAMQTRILKGMTQNLAERTKNVFKQFYPQA